MRTLSYHRPPPQKRPLLIHRHAVRRGREDSVGAGEGLCASLQLGDVLGGGDALVLDEVVQEEHHVGREASDLARGHKRVDGGGAVGALVQLPRLAGDRRGGDGRAGGGDGAGAANGRQPYHDLVLVGTARRAREPQVVGHVGDQVGTGVAASGGGGRISKTGSVWGGGENLLLVWGIFGLTSTSRWMGWR